MSGRTDSNDDDPNQFIPSDPSPTDGHDDIEEPQDDKASQKSLSSLSDYRSSGQQTRIGTPTLDAITAINALANGGYDGVDDTEDGYEDGAENENEDQDGDGGESNDYAGPSDPQNFEIWDDGPYDDHDDDGSGNGTDHEGNHDQDEEDEDEALIDSTRAEYGSQELLTPPSLPRPNQPPLPTVGQQLPPHNADPWPYLGPPPDQQPEQQDFELPPTHGLPRVQGLGRMGESPLSNPLQDSQTHYGAGSFDGYTYQSQDQCNIHWDSDGVPVLSPLPSPEVPLPPLPEHESFLGHAPTRQNAGQDQYQDQPQDQSHNPNGLPQSDQFLDDLLQRQRSVSTEYENGVPVGGGSGREAFPGQVLPSIEGPNDQHGVAGSTRSNPLSLRSRDGEEPVNNGSRPETAITISTGSSESGTRPGNAITISTSSSENGSRPETTRTISTGSSESGGAGPAPAGDDNSGQGHDEETDQAPPEDSTTGQDQDEEPGSAPANEPNESDIANTGSDQNGSEHVSPLAQVSPVYGTSSGGIDEATLDESVVQRYYYIESDSEERSRPYDPTSPTYSPSPERQTAAGYPSASFLAPSEMYEVYGNPHPNPIYPYSHPLPTTLNTSQGPEPDIEPNIQENYGHDLEYYHTQHVEEDPQQLSQHAPEEQALYQNLIDENRLDAPIALARDIVDVMREIINSASNSRHSSPIYPSPAVTPSEDWPAPAIPAPVSFSTHYHRFFEPETGSETETYFRGAPRIYQYVPAVPESPGVGLSEGEDEAEVGFPPIPVHTSASVPTIAGSRRLNTPGVDTESEPERQPSNPTALPRPILLRSLGIRESPGVRSARSSTPVSERAIKIEPRQDGVPDQGPAEEREAGPEPKREPEAGPELKSEKSVSDSEPRLNEISQANRDLESVRVKSEPGSDRELGTIPGYESAPESQPSTRGPSDAGSEYKPGPEPDTDSEAEAELGNNQQLVADLEQDELDDAGREQAQEQKQESVGNSGSEKQTAKDPKYDYHLDRESAPSPSPSPTRNHSPAPRRMTRAYARQIQQGQQASTQAAKQGPSETKKGKGRAPELRPSPSPRGVKRKESSSPSPPSSPPKKRATQSQTFQQEPKKANSGGSKGKGKATTSKGTKRRAESVPETKEPVTKKRRVTETETETEKDADSKQPMLKHCSNPRVATRADERHQRCTYHPVPKGYIYDPSAHPNPNMVASGLLINTHHAKVSPLIVNNPPTAKRSVYVFGANSHGQLGLGHAQANVTHPTLNTGLTKDTVGVVDLAAGGNHCVALTYDNRVLTWGDNSDGQLGRETQAIEEETTPMEVDFTAVGLPAETVFVQVAATESATFVLTEFGDVYGWGTFRETYSNEADEEVSILIGFRPSVTFQRTPMHIPELKYVRKLATGAQHVLALTLTEDADLIRSKSRNRRASTVPAPVPSRATNRITKSKPKSKARAKTTTTTKPENAVFAWGAYKRDQLGRRILGRQRAAATAGLTPRLVALPGGKTKCDIASIGAGAYHSFAVRVDGYVYAWGYNRYGQTGVVDDGVNLFERDSTVSVPTGLEGVALGCLDADMEYMLTGGADHSLAVTNDGRCLSWGYIEGNALGIRKETMSEDDLLFEEGSKMPSILAKPMTVPGVDSRVEKASAGLGHSIVVTNSGTAYAWGSNGDYEVRQPRSNGADLPSAIQTSVLRGLRVVDAAAGRQFSVLLVE